LPTSNGGYLTLLREGDSADKDAIGEHIEIFEARTNRRALQDQYKHSIGGACGVGEATCRSLTDWMPNFTKSLLAIVPEYFGMMLLRLPEVTMPSFSPALIQTMRAALDEAMTKIPLEQATPGIKAALAEYILKTAASGQTSYEGLLSAASEQIQTLLSTMT
jgi:hypothetical protein